MPRIGKRVLDLLDVKEKEYIDWCIENDKDYSKTKTIDWFIERVLDGRIVRDIGQNKLVNKHIKKDVEDNNNKPIGKRNRPFCEFEFTTEEQCNNFIKLLNSQEDYIAIGDVILKRDLITYALKEIR